MRGASRQQQLCRDHLEDVANAFVVQDDIYYEKAYTDHEVMLSAKTLPCALHVSAGMLCIRKALSGNVHEPT